MNLLCQTFHRIVINKLMDYKKHYDILIERARNRVLDSPFERHHIIPKCLGGSNKKENIARLTPEEHFVAHQLLVKMYPGNHGLIKAANMMCVSGKGYIRNNRMYGWIRKELSRVMSEEKKGKPRSEETKQKLREANLGKTISLEIIQKIKNTKKKNNKERPPISDETRKKISESNKGRISPRKGAVLSDETKKKLSEKCGRPQPKGIPRSEEVKRKISLAVREHNKLKAEKRNDN
jgi:hypothetical protein